MFESARLKLTAWYLLIIMSVSMLFSVAIYQTTSSEIERIINRIEYRQSHPDDDIPERPPQPLRSLKPPSVQDLENSRNKLFFTLLIINGCILIYAGGASYFLAGRTLRPIKIMIDEQNNFISSASHELRTPLATMRAEMEANLMEKHLTDKQARELIKSNLEELTTLQDLTNNLLRLNHIHANTFKKDTEQLNLKDILSQATKKTSQLAKQKHIELKMDVKDSKVLGNKHDITELFVILLDNAIKYSPAHTKIEIRTEETKEVVRVSVSDQGQGIAEEDLHHIFERFYRADKSRSDTDGYGLGLSIAKRIVDTHDGVITVQSSQKKGTTFTVVLPLTHLIHAA